jgi:crotonobetainyl-CoA:carnitine CoA-transferase CaiB-like acyl-CoA transferase
MSESDVPITGAPLLGRHTEEVIAQDLGMTNGQLEELKARKIIVCGQGE